MRAVLHYLRDNKRYWIPPILLVAGLLLYVAWTLARTPGSPFDYAIR